MPDLINTHCYTGKIWLLSIDHSHIVQIWKQLHEKGHPGCCVLLSRRGCLGLQTVKVCQVGLMLSLLAMSLTHYQASHRLSCDLPLRQDSWHQCRHSSGNMKEQPSVFSFPSQSSYSVTLWARLVEWTPLFSPHELLQNVHRGLREQKHHQV